MESQFRSPYPGPLLGDISFNFPSGTHAIGRLDKNTEGLLLLTTNKKVTALLFQSKISHKRTYLVQVKHKVESDALEQLRSGVCIRIKGGQYYKTPPCNVQLINRPEELFPSPLLQSDKAITSWLKITLTEGKYHQVRKMVSAVRHRCLRLIRVSIEGLMLGNIQPGEVIEIDEDFFFASIDHKT